MNDLRCPKCKFGNLFRTNREGFFEKNLYVLRGYYPWLCASCKRRSLVKARGERRREREEFKPISTPKNVS